MSKSQRKIANYIIDHPDVAPFLTASKLAHNVGVGEATVIRFAVFLGYQGYPDFQWHLQEALKRKWTSAERFEKTTEGGDSSPSEVWQEVLSDDIQNIKSTMDNIDHDDFQQAVQAIIEAKRIYIVAYRSAQSIGQFLEFYLDLVLQNTELIRQADGVSEHLLDINERDLVIGMGFSRYTKRTVDILKYVRTRGAKTLVITDHVMSPLAPLGDIQLFTSVDINSFIDSFTAPLSMINALITAVTRSEQGKVKKRLEQLEDLWDNFQVFYE
ncbi:MurR/RpiR family transcriptional regulator [Fervidibacillus halotolerans]|uniref:MurR/RpiR family transcriptional regulator n=1 Tax=Fervidibacillus halotolerans TaxID=2980027 RepID=A0A9E8M0Y1_9BACI|nr:MurR/RpiR family transcriptional regulator [Fervidibacillus halotolerans]WAA12952.1 MurR/RpiR family transcriptional regulator [Fervidibacillus halotolerans]